MAELDFGKQVGPLPLGAWVVVVGGGLTLAYFVNRNQQQPDAERQPLVEPGVGTGLVPAGAAFQSDSGTDSNAGDAGPTNNQQWGQQATNWLIAQGHDPTKSDNAVRKYLASEDLTLEENALIALVLSASGLGSPPEPLAPVETPEIPEEEQPENAPGGPQIQLNFVKSVPRHESPVFTGRVAYGATGSSPNSTGVSPGSPQRVRVLIHHSITPAFIISAYFTETDSDGNFSTRPGWDNPSADSRRYSFEWKGARKSDLVYFT